jgi:hypothetical protein
LGLILPVWRSARRSPRKPSIVAHERRPKPPIFTPSPRLRAHFAVAKAKSGFLWDTSNPSPHKHFHQISAHVTTGTARANGGATGKR